MMTSARDTTTRSAPGDGEVAGLLRRSWMTHDAMWFKAALDELGVEAANRLNRAAIRAMAPFEVRRVLAAIGQPGVTTFDELRSFMDAAARLLIGDLIDFSWTWEPPDRVSFRIDTCFADKGMARLGVLDRYECGIYERVYAWLDALGVRHTVSPCVTHCTRFHEGTCARDLRLELAHPAAPARGS